MHLARTVLRLRLHSSHVLIPAYPTDYCIPDLSKWETGIFSFPGKQNGKYTAGRFWRCSFNGPGPTNIIFSLT